MVTLSIIIPVYNVQHKIEKCVNSILQQTFVDFEILLINDGSTDESGIICDHLARLDNRVRVIHKENTGVSQTRNVGIDFALGKYIGWVDGDDWIEPEMYEELIKKAESENLDLVWSNFYIDYENSHHIVNQCIEANSDFFITKLLDLNLEGMLWNKIMKSYIFHKNNLRFLKGQDMAEDKTILIKFLFYSKRIGFVDKAFYHYLQDNPISYTRDLSSKRIYEEINNAIEITCFLESHKLDISQKVLFKYQLHAKRRLLYSKNFDDIMNWSNIFPKSNWYILSNRHFYLRHKILAICSILKLSFIINMWIKFKH